MVADVSVCTGTACRLGGLGMDAEFLLWKPFLRRHGFRCKPLPSLLEVLIRPRLTEIVDHVRLEWHRLARGWSVPLAPRFPSNQFFRQCEFFPRVDEFYHRLPIQLGGSTEGSTLPRCSERQNIDDRCQLRRRRFDCKTLRFVFFSISKLELTSASLFTR
jgi:hypothetical protein